MKEGEDNGVAGGGLKEGDGPAAKGQGVDVCALFLYKDI
jgi:hypothetical protein